MKNNRFIPRLGISGVLVLVMVVTLAWSAAFAQQAPAAKATAAEITWLWSAESSLLNRSTAALAMGHHARALRFAREAADTSSMPVRTVAAHNACLALLAMGDLISAQSSCRMALQAPDTPVAAFRGAMVVDGGGELTEGTASLRNLIHANIAYAYGRSMVSRIVAVNNH